MDYKQSYLNEYSKLFKEYKLNFEFAKKEYLNSVGKNYMHFTVTKDANPEYYRIEEEFKNKMKGLNAPLLKMSKYKIGDSVNVLRYGMPRDGKINRIKVSDAGSGELLYFFEDSAIFPNGNNYLLENDIVGLREDKITKIDSGKYAIMVVGKTSATGFHDSYEIAEKEAIRLVNKENKPAYVLMAVSLVELNSVKVTSLTN